MSLRELRRECEEGLADLPLPTPFDVAELVANMERAGGRTLVLHELPERFSQVDSACGLRLKADNTSFVLYRRRPTAYQTQHVILHELCHEWFDHGTSLDAEQLRRLLPVFDTSLIERVLRPPENAAEPTAAETALDEHAELPPGVGKALRAGGPVQARAQYDTHEERVAELGASLIPRMARELTSDDMVGRLANSLSRPVAHRRRGLFGRRTP